MSFGFEAVRQLFPATERLAYFNTAAVSLGSTMLQKAYSDFISEWTKEGLDWLRAEAAGERARGAFARIIGAKPEDVALVPAVSTAAGMIASQFGKAQRGENILIGEREYSSNHFPWRLLERKGYEVRQVPFRNGGLEPDDIEEQVNGGTKLIAFSAVQTASGHLSDIGAIATIAHQVGALTFVDGAQMAGALQVASYLDKIDVFATPNHKFLLNAARGVGYCYIHKRVQDRLTPICAGWKAGAVPMESFFGPEMKLSGTASRFDHSTSWLSAIGDEVALSLFDRVGIEAVYERNLELVGTLRKRLSEIECNPIEVPVTNRSSIVSIPLGEADPGALLSELKNQGVIASARDGNLRVAVHFYNSSDDIDRLVGALQSGRTKRPPLS